jgi:hypothetical protein
MDPKPIPGVHRADAMSFAAQDELLAPFMKTMQGRGDAYDDHCFLGERIDAPFDAVFEYCADVRSLSEWTMNIAHLEPVGDDLYRGKMIFSSADANDPKTDIYIRSDPMRGRDHGLICYPCAWDQGDDLWMRYYFILADAQKTLGRPGTAVLWVNCKHVYYDRAEAGVPKYIEEGRARTDRPWAGDGWKLFYPLHQVELGNLKRIAEARFGSRRA